MNIYLVKYYFDNEFNVTRKVESELSKDGALINATSGDHITFEDSSRGVYYSFQMKDVKLVSIQEDKKPKVVSKPPGFNL